MANELAKTKKTGITSFLSSDAVRGNIETVVGKKATQTFIASVVSAVQTNPSLQNCTNTSILSAALLGESLKLPPSPQLGNMYLVPYKNNGVQEAQFQLGYKGMIQLAIRSGQYRKIVASEVKDGEIEGFNPITEEFTINPIMDVKARSKKETVGYYAMLELVNGFKKELFWTKEQMEAHAKRYSKGYARKSGYTFWEKDFDSMAKKTMLRQLISKWGIMSTEMQTAYQADMSVVREDGSFDYVDSADIETEVVVEIEENANQEEFIDADVEV